MKSAVLFLIFKREETTRKVFERIREVQPPKLYIAADGPRADRPEEKEKCEATRKVVENIDWPCEVHKLFQDENLGCGKGVSTAITWFFKNEPEGIIVEDDILAHPDFFRFCDEMLEKYRSDEKVMVISGHNNLYEEYKTDKTYYLSHNGGIWGWATWRRAWNGFKYDVNDVSYDDLQKSLKLVPYPKCYVKTWLAIYKMMCNYGCDTWDYQWGIHVITHKGLAIVSYKNMTYNIGLASADAAHTTGEDKNEMNHYAQPIYPFEQNAVTEDWEADNIQMKIVFGYPSIFTRVVNKLKRAFC